MGTIAHLRSSAARSDRTDSRAPANEPLLPSRPLPPRERTIVAEGGAPRHFHPRPRHLSHADSDTVALRHLGSGDRRCHRAHALAPRRRLGRSQPARTENDSSFYPLYAHAAVPLPGGSSLVVMHGSAPTTLVPFAGAPLELARAPNDGPRSHVHLARQVGRTPEDVALTFVHCPRRTTRPPCTTPS